MSRHRNVRNMIEEDYYDYDEYDDYDDDYVAPPKKPASAGKSKGKPQTPVAVVADAVSDERRGLMAARLVVTVAEVMTAAAAASASGAVFESDRC